MSNTTLSPRGPTAAPILILYKWRPRAVSDVSEKTLIRPWAIGHRMPIAGRSSAAGATRRPALSADRRRRQTHRAVSTPRRPNHVQTAPGASRPRQKPARRRRRMARHGTASWNGMRRYTIRPGIGQYAGRRSCSAESTPGADRDTGDGSVTGERG